MSWRPSTDKSIAQPNFSPFWAAMESVYDNVADPASLPRAKWEQLRDNYIIIRKGSSLYDAEAGKRRLPAEFRDQVLGEAEISILDVIINMEGSRAALVEGPRGAGKTSLLHYIEAVTANCYQKCSPIFLIINGLQLASLNDDRLEAEIEEDFAHVIRGTLHEKASNTLPPLNDAFLHAALRLETDRTQAAIREAFRELGAAMGEADQKRLIVAFDNLDHLSATYIGLAVNLARQITSVAKFSCLICLRPNVVDGLVQGGDARAFFQFRIPVNQPDIEAWLNRLGQRATARARKEAEENRAPPSVLGKNLNPGEVGAAFDRFAQLLTIRRYERPPFPQDDVLAMLEAIAADDTRQLQILIRRMLRDGRLPSAYLVGLVDEAEFHPVGALIDGGQTIFKHDRFVPNLLVFEAELGNPDFLIAHRILCLLDRRENIPIAQLLIWMGLLGYTNTVVLQILQQLAGPLLVRASNTEIFRVDSPPLALGLSEAGYYYRDHLLGNADYLISAVLDVPLEHEAFREFLEGAPDRVKSGRFFAPRVHSLLEYTNLVVDREARQVFGTLHTAPASAELRRVADALRHGGLLTRSLLRGLTTIAERSANVPNLRELLKDMEPNVSAIQSKAERIEKRLEELVNRGRRSPVQDNRTLLYSVGKSIIARLASRGDEAEVTVEIQLSSSDVVALIAMDIEVQGQRVTQSAVAIPRRRSGDRRSQKGVVEATATLILPGTDGISERSVRFGRTEISATSSRTLFLAPHQRDKCIQLFLYRLSNGARGEPLGPPVDLTQLEQVSAALTAKVNLYAGSGTLNYRFIKEAGTELARLVLDAPGANKLASLLPAHERVIIHSPEQEMVIPWEWLCPWPIGPQGVKPLAQGLQAVRWVGSPFDAATSIHQWEGPRRVESLCTIGLGVDPDRPWRIQTPDDPEELVELSNKYDITHLVGHWNDFSNEVQIQGTRDAPLCLTCETVRTYPIGRNDASLILSVCKVGQLKRSANLAIAIADLRNVAVWTPLTSIRENDADHLDDDVAKFVVAARDAGFLGRFSLGDFFRRRRQEHAWTHVYIRYGL